jgi:circadian clock protein KaiC
MPKKKKRVKNSVARKQNTQAEITDAYKQPVQAKYQQDVSKNLLTNSLTGIRALDRLLGGGFPSGSIVLLAGSSGSGKTILSFQWLFEGIKNNENGLYITLTEPLFKSLKNLETMSFYDRNAIEQEKLKIIDIRDVYEKKGFNQEKVISFLEEEVKKTNAKRLCIDSITAIAYNLDNKAKIRKFIFELGKVLAMLGCTTVLTSEVTEAKKFSMYGVEEFISDVIIRLDQVKVKEELHRVMQIIKVRGRSYKTEDFHFKISERGITIFPKIVVPLGYSSTTKKISTGNYMLDKMLLGGVFRGSSTLIAGSTGTGKSLLSMQFIMEGLKEGEPCLYAGFEESKEQLIRNAEGFGWNLREYGKKGLLVLRCNYPSEKFIEEHLADIKKVVERKKIKRCVIDSLSAISNSFPENVLVSFAKKLNGYLKMQNVTTLFTTATAALIGATELTESHLSTMVDNIVMLRYIETQGELNSVLNVLKVRGSAHSKGLRMYDITGKGIVIGQPLSGYEGILTGVTRKVSKTIEERLESEFKRFIGPMADSVFLELKDRGLTKENIFSYIDELMEEKILKRENADIFRKNVSEIMGGSVSGAYESEVSGFESHVLIPAKQSQPAAGRKEKKKRFVKKLFGED